jgi:hypothetical protein
LWFSNDGFSDFHRQSCPEARASATIVGNDPELTRELILPQGKRWLSSSKAIGIGHFPGNQMAAWQACC